MLTDWQRAVQFGMVLHSHGVSAQYQSKNTLQLPTINLNSTYLMPIGVYLIVTTTSVHSVNVWVKGGIFFYRCGWIPGLCAPKSREGILQAGSFRAHLLLLCKSGGILCLWWNYWMRSVHQALLKGGGHFNLGRLRSGAQSKDKRTLNKLRCVTVVYGEC